MTITRKEFLRTGAGVFVAASAPLPVASAFLTAVSSAEARRAKVEALAEVVRRTDSSDTPPSGVTKAIVEFIATATFDRIPEKVIHEAKRCLIDGFGVVLAGATAHGSAIVRETIKSAGGTAEASVLGPDRLQVPVGSAALANGASGHAMDYDDTQLSSSPDRVFGLLTHPTVPALAAALAVGERLGASGARLLEAFLVGFEVECKIAEAIDPSHYQRGFHSSGTIGTFAATAAGAKLMKLRRPAIAHAIGIAASMSAGIRVSFGSMTKPLHVGRAAENGVVAAQLASRGFTAGADALDGEWGFFQVLGGGADVGRIVPALGRPWSIVDPGVSVKPYPCGSLGQPTMDAMLKIVLDHDLTPDQIDRIRVRAGSNILNPLRYKTAKTELEAKFCVPFMVSAIALRRKAGIREFTDAFVASEPVQRLMTRVETMLDPEIEAKGFDKMRSIVEVTRTDGTLLVQPADERYRGGPEKPFTRADLHEKFTDCAALVLPAERIRRALEAIESLEKMKDVRQLVQILTSSTRS